MCFRPLMNGSSFDEFRPDDLTALADDPGMLALIRQSAFPTTLCALASSALDGPWGSYDVEPRSKRLRLSLFETQGRQSKRSAPTVPKADLVGRAHSIANDVRDCAPSEAMQRIANQLQTLARSSLEKHLLTVLSVPAELQAIAARSYRHGNGFVKVVLVATGGWKLRLHVWFPGAHAEMNLHEHRWHFASTVIHGALDSEIWQEAAEPDTTEFDEYRYYARGTKSEPYYEAAGKTRLLCTHHHSRAAGDAYCVAPGVIHRIVATHGLTSTLMFQAAPARSWNRLIPTSGVLPDVTQRYMDAHELRLTIERYLDLVAAN